MEETKLKNALYNAIILLYDNSLCSSIDDDSFVKYVCKEIGLTQDEYNTLMDIDKIRDKINIYANDIDYSTGEYSTCKLDIKQKDIPFIVSDIYGIVHSSFDLFGCDTINIAYIRNYYTDDNEKTNTAIQDILDDYNRDNDIIIVSSYLSKKEFPEDEYFLTDGKSGILGCVTTEDIRSMKPLPVLDVLIREGNRFKELGFIDINNYIEYQYKGSYVYDNNAGKIIIQCIDEVLNS